MKAEVDFIANRWRIAYQISAPENGWLASD